MRLGWSWPILIITACGTGKSSPTGEASDAVATSDAAGDAGVAGKGPVDAPPSSCTLGASCGDAGTCWQLPSGARACVSFEPIGNGQVGPACPADAGARPPNAPAMGACCSSHADCNAEPRGRCTFYSSCGGTPGPEGYACDYLGWCTRDEDCGGNRCVPAALAGTERPACLQAYCHSNADCTRKPGGTCRISPAPRACTTTRQVLYCSYPDDVCTVDPSTRASGCGNGECLVAADGQGTTCGPPLTFPP